MSNPPKRPAQKRPAPPRSRQPSAESLDVYIPSFPGSPRSLSIKAESSSSLPPSVVITPIVDEYRTKKPKTSLEIATDKPVLDKLEEDTNILVAAEIGSNDVIAELIRHGTDIQVMDHLGRNALHFAVQNGNMKAIEMLLKAGIDPTVKDKVGMTPLMLCLMRNPSLKIMKMLFEYGAEIIPRSKPMDTGIFIQFVMMCTPTSEDAEILKLLVEKGALVDDPNAPGQRQALHFAAMSNNCELIKILINLGANPYATNHRNETPRQVAQIFKCKEAASLLPQIENLFIGSYNNRANTTEENKVPTGSKNDSVRIPNTSPN